MTKASKKIAVDTLVVGAGLAGLFAAALRAQAGKKVLVVEASAKLGGRLSPERRNGFQLGAGLGFANSELWQKAYSAMGISYSPLSIHNGKCVVYNTKGWQEPEELPAWETYFTQPVATMPKGGFAGFIDEVM